MARLLTQSVREFVAVMLDMGSAYVEELAAALHVWSLSVQHPGYRKRYLEALRRDVARDVWK